MAIVYRLMHHTAGICTVTDDGNGIVILTRKAVRLSIAECGRDRGRAVSRTEGIMLAFTHNGEARESARLTKDIKHIAPAG